MIRHKFNAKPTTIDDIGFSSRKEANRYCELKLLQQSGEVVFFLIQVPFRLPGKVKYICDFQIFWADGTVTFEDVKGVRTPMFILKKKMVEELYPVEILEI
jgi:hypothetical protein